MIGRVFAALALSLTLIGGCLPALALAADKPPLGALTRLPSLQGDYFTVESKHVGRSFHIFVRLPPDYDPEGAERYPVVFLLDGDSLFPMLAPLHLLLHYDDKLPEAVVVGIAYGSFDPAINKRGHDFSLPSADGRTDMGGAPAFQRFLKGELLPQIDAQYHVDPAKRILVGQSRGGHFVLYSAMTEPDLFWGRIASSPAFFPAESWLSSGPVAPATRAGLKLMLFSGSMDRADLRASALAWDAAWTLRRDAPWGRRFYNAPGATHAANIGDAYRAGLRWFFEPSQPE